MNKFMNKSLRVVKHFILTLLFSWVSVWTPNCAFAKEVEFLEPEQAFQLQETIQKEKNKDFLVLQLKVAPGYLLYQEHVHFYTPDNKPLKSLEKYLPAATLKQDEILGTYKVYTQNFDIKIPVSELPQKGLKIEYQGCSEHGFCYPPISKNISASEKITDIASSSTLNAAVAETEVAPQPYESETDKIQSLLQSHNLLLTLITFLGLGILLAFTPCVLPMVPIMANILLGSSTKPLSKKRSFYLASLYVLSVAIFYAGAGLVAGFLGNSFQLSLQHPYLLITFSFILILFALSQFNFIHVQLPQIFSHSFHKLQQKQKQGSAISAVAFGALSALMLSPCVTPALIGALTYISQTGKAGLGGAALFVMAIGMGLPLLIAATVGSHLLPKVGSWMNHMKSITGVLLLILAISILMRAVPSTVPHQIQSEHGITAAFKLVQSPEELTQALDQAKSLNKPVLLDVYADWCVSCKQMDKEVFENQRLKPTLEKVYLLRLDMTRQTKATEELQKKLGIIGPPTVLFFGLDGQELKAYRLAGKSESSTFVQTVDHFLNHITKRNSTD